LIAERTCPALDIPDNGSLSTDLGIVGTVVVAQCYPGYTFPGKVLTQIVECIDFGDDCFSNDTTIFWNGTLIDCQGMLDLYGQLKNIFSLELLHV